MKKILRTLPVLIIGIIISLQVIAGDKDFNGIIIYNINYPDSKMDAQAMAMMPKTLKVTIKGDLSKTEMSLGMGSTVTIFNAEKQSGKVLMDMMGQKFAIAITPESLNKEIEGLENFKIEETDETKDIAGYQCKKVLVSYTSNGKATEHITWVTDELGNGGMNASNPIFKDVKGMMMEFNMAESGMTMQMQAVSVEKKKVSDKEFETPEGYKEVTEEELQNMFGG